MRTIGWMGLALTVALSGCDKKAEAKKSDDAKPASTGAASAAPAAPASAAPAGTQAPTAAQAQSAAPAPAAPGAVAAAHLPGDCDVAASIDLASVVAQPDVAKEIVPKLEEILKKGDSKDESFKRFQQAATELGLDPKKTFKTAAVCAKVVGQDKFGLVLAGELKPDTILAAIEKSMKPEKRSMITELDGRKVISDDKFTFGQAPDGAIVLANDKALFQALTATGDHHKSKYALALDKTISIVAGEALMKEEAKKKEFEKINKLSLWADLASMKLGAKLGVGDPGEAKKLETLLGEMRKVGEKDLEKDQSGALEVLKSLTAKADGGDVSIEGSIPEASIKKAVAQAAEGLKQTLSGL